jgi:hypothetical protein
MLKARRRSEILVRLARNCRDMMITSNLWFADLIVVSTVTRGRSRQQPAGAGRGALHY